MKRLFLLILVLGAMVSAQAQIGYKGQVTFGVEGGINHLKGYVASARVDGYLSAHSILGAGAMFERTRYDATQGDSFAVEQWIGVVHYRYALPVRRFIMLPTGGVLLGGESCDRYSQQGQWLRYGNQFIWGLYAEFGIEYVFGRHWTVYLAPRLQYLMKTNFDSLKISGSVGLKYYF